MSMRLALVMSGIVGLLFFLPPFVVGQCSKGGQGGMAGSKGSCRGSSQRSASSSTSTQQQNALNQLVLQRALQQQQLMQQALAQRQLQQQYQQFLVALAPQQTDSTLQRALRNADPRVRLVASQELSRRKQPR
jgi:hypothetical protein